MSDGAERRIRGRGQGASQEQKRARAPMRDLGPSLPVLVAASAALHVLFLVAVVYLPGLLPERDRPIKLYSVTMTKLPPGPAGGGGKQPEPVKPPPKPVEEPQVRQEPVKIPKKPAEKPKPQEKEPAAVAAPEKPQAPVGPGKGPVGGGREGDEVEGPITLDVGTDFPFGFYLDTIQKKVARGWYPPRTASRKKPRVTVFFRIDRMGRIKDIKVEQSSGVSMVDRSAMSAVTSASPLPPLPEGFEGDRLGVHYTFVVGE